MPLVARDPELTAKRFSPENQPAEGKQKLPRGWAVPFGR